MGMPFLFVIDLVRGFPTLMPALVYGLDFGVVGETRELFAR